MCVHFLNWWKIAFKRKIVLCSFGEVMNIAFKLSDAVKMIDKFMLKQLLINRYVCLSYKLCQEGKKEPAFLIPSK